MNELNGRWDCTTKTPLGDKRSIITFVVNGNTFTGSDDGEAGKVEFTDGKIEGDVITWSMEVQKPFRLKMQFTVSINNGHLDGVVKAGVLGSAKITGTKLAD